MKVLHVQKTSGIGGSERHLLALLPGLASRGLEIRVCLLAAPGAEVFIEALRDLHVDVTVLPAPRDLNPRLVGRIVRQIRAFDADLLHTHLIHADVHGQIAARIARVPAVSSIHSTHQFYRHEPHRTAVRSAWWQARQVVAISQHVAGFVQENRLAPTRRVQVIHYGIDPDGWVLSPRRRQAARRRFGLAKHDVAVGVASRLRPLKGHDALIDALAKASVQAPEMRLLIAGDGEMRAELERHAAETLPPGTGRFLGFLADPVEFMNACDIMVFPSLSEGFGLAALEAMAAARPLVANHVDSLPEIVLDGETGLLVSPGDVDQLADALVQLASNPSWSAELGRAGRERAVGEFSLEKMVDRTIEVYEAVGR